MEASMTEHINSYEDLHEEEIWKPVVGWEGFYEVSNMGRVRGLNRVVFCTGKDGNLHERHEKQRLKSKRLVRGYELVSLGKNGKQYSYQVHRLVLFAFVSPCPKGMQACHNDGIRTNNHLNNLRWDTPKNNHQDRIRHGTMISGNNHYRTKLSDEDLEYIWRVYTPKHKEYGAIPLSKKYGVHWKHLEKVGRLKRRLSRSD
jgi:hypothetical protein